MSSGPLLDIETLADSPSLRNLPLTNQFSSPAKAGAAPTTMTASATAANKPAIRTSFISLPSMTRLASPPRYPPETNLRPVQDPRRAADASVITDAPAVEVHAGIAHVKRGS